MAKDVTTFLNWAAEPEHDDRKKIGIKAVILFSTLTALSLYVKRFKWTVIKNRKLGASPITRFRSQNRYSDAFELFFPYLPLQYTTRPPPNTRDGEREMDLDIDIWTRKGPGRRGRNFYLLSNRVCMPMPWRTRSL